MCNPSYQTMAAVHLQRFKKTRQILTEKMQTTWAAETLKVAWSFAMETVFVARPTCPALPVIVLIGQAVLRDYTEATAGHHQAFFAGKALCAR